MACQATRLEQFYGRMEAPILPDQTVITRCSNCDKFYWIEKARIIGKYDWFNGKDEVPVKWKKAPSVQDPDIADFVAALEHGLGDTLNREKYLRTQHFMRVHLFRQWK
jgi:hypothetical protein